MTFDSDSVAGDTSINADRSTSETSIANITAGASAGIHGDGLTSNGGVNIGYTPTEAVGNVNLSGT